MTPSVSNRFAPGRHDPHPRKTFADYAATAICPILIMVMVGSLVFFLIQITYAGSHTSRLHWTLFWFVLAMVLVSRIAIEKGSEYAAVFGFGLAAATTVMLLQYVGNHWAVWLILGLIWWATHKLTWDSTVIDDDLDASGEGLLQAAKLNPREDDKTPLLDPEAALPHPVPSTHKASPRTQSKKRWWRRRAAKRTNTSQPHAPGLWVIYFSLSALPVFGLGQGLIPAHDATARQHAFSLLVWYVVAALGLLLITSFLGLRRYLRQRHLEMPSAMSVAWLATGTVIGLAIVAGCVLLPRPNAYWSMSAMIDRLGDRPASASRNEVAGHRLSASGSNRKNARDSMPSTNNQETRPERSANATETKVDQQEGQKLTAASQKPNPSDHTPAHAQGASHASSSPASTSSPTLRVPTRLLKMLFYAILVLAVLWLAVRNRRELLKALQAFWRSIQEFWISLFAKKRSAGEPGSSVTPTKFEPNRPFAAFGNPFGPGQNPRMSLPELIVHSFDGLEAWAEEQRCGRRPDQTPFEFAESLGDQVPDLANEAKQVARLYAQVAYARAASLPACQPVLEALWIKMTTLGRTG